MEIQSVYYTRLVNLGNYENEKVGASAAVNLLSGETPEEALENLRAWVNDKVTSREEYEELSGSVSSLRSDKIQLEYEIRHLKEQLEALKAVLSKFGVEPKELDEFPF